MQAQSQITIQHENSFDGFLADSFEFYLKEDISDAKFKKIEQATLLMWGLNVTECIMSDFGKMHLRDELLNDITPMHKRIKLFLKNNLKSQNAKSKKLQHTLQTVQSKINAIEEQIKNK